MLRKRCEIVGFITSWLLITSSCRHCKSSNFHQNEENSHTKLRHTYTLTAQKQLNPTDIYISGYEIMRPQSL